MAINLSVWFAIPSKRPTAECVPVLAEWKKMGYRIAVQRDLGEGEAIKPETGYIVRERPYTGYSDAVNLLVREILCSDPDAQWIVTGGDDILPDPIHSARLIGAECTLHFDGTFGVMQPIGDDWQGSNISAICGSPWMGREFCQRINGGQGPMWHSYFHMFNDEEMQLVCQRLGILWQRPDLVHKHMHWGRPREGEKHGRQERMPAFLARANSQENWRAMKRIFEARKAAGFPGSDPI